MEYTKGDWYPLFSMENRYHVMSTGKTGDMELNIAVMSVRPEAKANAYLIAASPLLYGACNFFICNIGFVKVADESKDLLGVLKFSIEQALAKVDER